jgi:hypothetical protein
LLITICPIGVVVAVSNTAFNLDHGMAVRTDRYAFIHFGRDLIRRHPQSYSFGNPECLTRGIPVMEFKATGVSQATMDALS